MELSQNIGISTDPETKGFDLSAGNTWIYPENYPVREYQYNIVKSALYCNTLVCLPTGLGKTFIAAVVMYNFWRWYPFGKIIFLAPTKPLVAQQINACYEVMGIPSIDVVELTGAVIQKNREIAWMKKRIIFATPQVFHNDLEKSIVPSHLVKCVVVDEAHKALGKHSYCECIRILSMQNEYFRILALSATPGNKMDNVHEVIENLRISRLELRDENSLDIIPYINKRKVDIILVPLSNELATFKDRYIIIMDRHVKLLIEYNVLRGQTANISKGRVFHLLKEFKTKTNKSGNYGQIMKTLNILLTMYHAYELMIRHGLRAFCKFYQNHSDKFWMQSENQLQKLICDIEAYLGPFPDLQSRSNEFTDEIPKNLVFGHNKFHKLKELLEYHFRSNNSVQKDTRAIVFVEYREIVNEVYILLLQSQPMIRPQIFVGQASQKQKQQIKAIEDFRNNRVNVLISTSIGEEGLDVGEVDLIICFDVSQHSPTRLVQRMGRTGRKRDGHIIVLVTDGKEHENLKSTLSKRDSLNNKILNTSKIFFSFYENNHRMIPNHFTPDCHKIYIIALPKTPIVKDKRKKKAVSTMNETCNIRQKNNSFIAMQNNIGQSSMTKFLTNGKQNEQETNNQCKILIPLTSQSEKFCNTIDPNDVKLLSNDNAGIDFLTLCAVKQSEEEMSTEIIHKMSENYVPTSKPVKNLFKFVIPDVKILDCLSFLNTSLSNNLLTQRKGCENENVNDNKDDIFTDDDDNFWYIMQNEKNVEKISRCNQEIRFEDILDESSDSDKTTVSCLSRGVADVKIEPKNSINITNKNSIFNITNGNEIMATKTELFNSTLKDMQPSTFEDLLNDSFSSIEDSVPDKHTGQLNIKSPIASNNANQNAEKIDITCEINSSTVYNKNNVDKFNKRLSTCMELVKPCQINKCMETFSDEMQGSDFNSDDDVNGFICKFNRNKSYNTEAEESFLSVTQAIKEITEIKGNLRKLPVTSIIEKQSDNDDSCGWITVNTKCEKRIENKNISTIKNKISNIHNFTMQSCNTKQTLDFLDDSDEDFIISEDNAKKFDELESSYFKNTSQNSETKDSYLCNTSKDFEIENEEFCNTSKIIKPCSKSTPKDNTNFGLSLKRSRNQHPNAIDLSIFKAPNKYVNNRRDTNHIETNTSEQISSMSKKTTQKINRRYKHSREKIKNEFIDDEARVSSDASSDESVDSEEDLTDFVSYTQNVQDDIDMHAHYLRTIKSPVRRPGVFHLKKLRSPESDVEIYSQSLSQVQDSYLYDSFCVKEDAEPSILAHGDSILETAENELKRNKRKRSHSDKSNVKQSSKRKRINVLNNSMSSEDEIEKMRVQVQEN